MGLMKPRVSSYVDRGNELIAKGKTKQAMNLVSHGLQLLWSSIFVTLVAKKYHESVTLPSGLRMVYDNH